ncbi:MAG: MoaD/ThiS family protein [Roseovarius sp.]
MVKVRLWGSLADATGGAREVEIEADTLRALLDALAESYPGLRPQLDRGVSVAIDGRIYNDSWFTPIRPDSEVVLLARLKGG